MVLRSHHLQQTIVGSNLFLLNSTISMTLKLIKFGSNFNKCLITNLLWTLVEFLIILKDCQQCLFKLFFYKCFHAKITSQDRICSFGRSDKVGQQHNISNKNLTFVNTWMEVAHLSNNTVRMGFSSFFIFPIQTSHSSINWANVNPICSYLAQSPKITRGTIACGARIKLEVKII